MDIITDYRNKNILAPMVRCGCLSFRLLALEYGADIVYSEEVIDLKMINAKRKVNDVFKTIDFVVEGFKKPVFQTSEKEKGKVVFQLGTCDPQRALKVCKIVESDVAAVDINMGCPKEFSVQGGMGSALLTKPDLVKEILTTLVNGCSIPITCKIRCLPTIEETINLCKIIEKCGVKAIGVHGRFQYERSRNPNHDDFIAAVAKEIKIPIIANGGSNVIKTYEDIDVFKKSCGVDSVMIARSAMWNCSVFRKEGNLPLDVVLKRFLELSLETDNFFFNTKYVVQNMLHEELQSTRGCAVLSSLCGEELYQIFGMLNEFNQLQEKITNSFSQEVEIIKRKSDDDEEINQKIDDENAGYSKKIKSDDLTHVNGENNIISKHAKYFKKDFRDGTVTPKSILHTYTMDKNLPRPIYKTEEKKPERVFKSVVEINDGKCSKWYTTPYWEANKQSTEQQAAMVALEFLGIDYKLKQAK